jgi:hypothetical protein
MDSDQGLMFILNTLLPHRQKNFVQRMLLEGDYPKLYDAPGGDFSAHSTHSMTWGTDDKGNAYVYPTVIQPGTDQPLRRLTHQQAWNYARLTGELIPFGADTAAADWFSKNYKQLWKK